MIRCRVIITNLPISKWLIFRTFIMSLQVILHMFLRTLYRFICHNWGASKSMTKDVYLKLCTALVEKQVFTWVTASSFVMLLEASQVWRMKRYNVLKAELVYRTRVLV